MDRLFTITGENTMNILLTGAFPYTEGQIRKIKALGYETIFIQDERGLLGIDSAQIDAVVCNGLFLYHDIASFSRLKYIQLTSAGLDRVPVDYINEHGIALYNARGVYSIPMAEWIILKTLELYKHSGAFYRAQEQKSWNKDRSLLELYGKTVCIVGAGSIGLEAAKRFSAFGAQVLAVDAYPVQSEYFGRLYHPKELCTALSQSDIAVLTLPLTEQTKHLFNRDIFEQMKTGCILVNVSRGAVVKEEDLVNALLSGKLSGAALDVFEEEPLKKESPLWNMERVIVTPHNSFISDNTPQRLYDLIYTNLSKQIEKNVKW